MTIEQQANELLRPQPESSGPVMQLYAIELPDGSIAMQGPYVLATEDEGQAGRMAHARDGIEIKFVREIEALRKRELDAGGGDEHVAVVIGGINYLGLDAPAGKSVKMLRDLTPGAKLYTQPTTPPAVEGEEMCPRMASMIEHGMSGINWTPTPTKLVSESERVTMTDVDRFIKATPPGEAVSGDALASANCPICGYDQPHGHAGEEIALHRGAVDRGDPISHQAYGQAFSDAVRGDIDFRFSGDMISAIRSRAWEIQSRLNRSPAAIGALAKREVGGAAEHWHNLYRKECRLRQDDAARYGAELESLEAPTPAVEVTDADMFWDNSNNETCHHSIDEILEFRWEQGLLENGHKVAIQQAMRLPDIMVCVTIPEEYPDGDGDITWEIDQLPTTQPE